MKVKNQIVMFLIILISLTIVQGLGSNLKNKMRKLKIHQENNDNIKDVIIIGAGASGIAAGLEMERNNKSYLILEGRDRPCGRVHSSLEFGYPIDNGAILITHQKDNPIVEYSKMFNIKLVNMDFGNLIAFIKNKSINKNLLFTRAFMLKKKFENWIFTNYNSNLSIIENYKIYSNELSHEDQIFLKYSILFYQSNLKRKVNDIKDFILSNDTGFEVTKFSMTPDGYQNILNPLAEKLSIKYKTKIVEINRFENYVEVVDADKNKYMSKTVLVTVPLAILKKEIIKFTPSLNEEINTVINKLAVFDMNKIFIEFEEKFWGDTDFLTFLPNIDDLILFDLAVNFHKVNNKNLLIFLISSETSINEIQSEIKMFGEESVKQKYIDVLKQAYPGKNIKITNFKVTSWNLDEFSLGSFSEIAGDSKDRSKFHIVEKRTYFAGEHTSLTHNAFVYGAFMSGLRASKQIITDLEN